jgi:hypothetical protein
MSSSSAPVSKAVEQKQELDIEDDEFEEFPADGTCFRDP